MVYKLVVTKQETCHNVMAVYGGNEQSGKVNIINLEQYKHKFHISKAW